MRTITALAKIACGAAALLLVTTACHRKEETPFPPGIEPLEENLAPAPEGDDDDPYPERLSMVSGVADEYEWVHARGYVHASIAETWEAFQQPDVVVDRRRVAEWETELDVEPEWAFSALIHHVVRDIVTVEYDLSWRHGLVSGTLAAPDVVGMRWQKTYGTSLIDYLRGSVVLVAVEDDVTELQIIEHLGALTMSTADIEIYFDDLFADVLAWVHHEQLQDFD